MLRTFLQTKVHRARVTRSDLNYEGSIAIDPDLIEAAQWLPYEKVEIYDINNGQRFATYVIVGERGSGEICVNGAAARLVQADDLVIICSYVELAPAEIERHTARVVFVDADNRVREITETPVIDHPAMQSRV
jgi:aspartate 1-decarboxylase